MCIPASEKYCRIVTVFYRGILTFGIEDKYTSDLAQFKSNQIKSNLFATESRISMNVT